MSRISEQTLWGIHAGRTGDAHRLFMEQNVVGLGWAAMGDLSLLPPDRESFKKRLLETHPDTKEGAAPVNTGQLFRFIHEAQTGDLVVYHSKHDKIIHIGRILGEYIFDDSSESSYPHRRKCEWLKEFPRTTFSQGALYEIGSAMSFFQVKNYAEEFVNALQGIAVAPVREEDDQATRLVAEELGQTVEDFVLKRLSQELKGYAFQDFVADLLRAMGYRARVFPEGPDGGIDVIAHRDELGFEPPIIKVQTKSGSGSVGDPAVSALTGKLAANEYGLVITLGTFTTQAKTFAANKSNIRLINGQELVNLIIENYERLDAQFKAVIPLKNVYVPDPIES